MDVKTIVIAACAALLIDLHAYLAVRRTNRDAPFDWTLAAVRVGIGVLTAVVGGGVNAVAGGAS